MNWLTGVGDELLAALLVYGYPVLALTLLLGAVGLPLPSALVTSVAGALAAQGLLRWEVSIGLAVSASVIGDLIGYRLGMLGGTALGERLGPRVGLTSHRYGQAAALFERWAGLSIVLTRSLLSVLSPAVNLLAGASRYRLGAFVGYDLAGRLLWTGAYFGLGYVFGDNVEAVVDFVTSLSGFLIALAIAVGAAYGLGRRRWSRLRTMRLRGCP